MSKPLPKISYPTHNIKIPTSGETYRYRPILVHEHRILMTAQETVKQLKGLEALRCLSQAVAQVIASCLSVEESVVNKFHATDLTYAFIKIRSKSIGDVCEPVVICPHCNTRNKLRVVLSSIEPKIDPKWKPNTPVKLNDSVGIELQIPGMIEALDKSITSTENGEMSPVDTFRYIALAIKTIFRGEEVTKSSEYTMDELLEFIDGFSIPHLEEINTFLKSVPRLSHRVDYVCVGPECKKPGFVVLENLRDFF